jgi:hypothetical protein
MLKLPHPNPCRSLNAEQRAEVERQLRAQGRLRNVSAVELEKIRSARRLLVAVKQRQVASYSRE